MQRGARCSQAHTHSTPAPPAPAAWRARPRAPSAPRRAPAAALCSTAQRQTACAVPARPPDMAAAGPGQGLTLLGLRGTRDAARTHTHAHTHTHTHAHTTHTHLVAEDAECVHHGHTQLWKVEDARAPKLIPVLLCARQQHTHAHTHARALGRVRSCSTASVPGGAGAVAWAQAHQQQHRAPEDGHVKLFGVVAQQVTALQEVAPLGGHVGKPWTARHVLLCVRGRGSGGEQATHERAGAVRRFTGAGFAQEHATTMQTRWPGHHQASATTSPTHRCDAVYGRDLC
jgi:hypothetical protein